MQKSVLLRELQQEIRRHDFNCFVDQPPSVAEGGKGVVVPGCPACQKRIITILCSTLLTIYCAKLGGKAGGA